MSESAHPVPSPEQPGPARQRDLGEFGRWLRSQGLVRPAGQPVAGVSAALSIRFGLDVTLVRVLVVVLCVLLTPAAYGLAWLLFPDSDQHILLEDLINGQISAGTVGGGLLILIGLPNGGFLRFGDPDGGPPVFLLAMLALAVWWFLAGRRRGRRPHDPDPARGQHEQTDALAKTAQATPMAPQESAPTAAALPVAPRPVVVTRPALPWQATLGIIGTAAIVAGVVALLGAGTVGFAPADLVGREAVVFGLSAAAAAAVCGLAMIGSGIAGRRAGWVTALGLLSAGLALGAVSSPPNFEVGNQSYAPAVVQDTTIDHGVGNLDVDLTATEPLPRPLPDGDVPTTNLSLGVGNTTITVSDELAVELLLDDGIGNVVGVSDTDEPQRIGRKGGPPDLRLNVDMGVGNLTVEEVSS